MATTSQGLTWIELECHGWDREGPRGTRALFNEAQRLLKLKETRQNLVVSGGQFPFLATTAGDYDYTLPDDVWKTRALVLDPNSANSLDDIDLRLEDITLSGKTYQRILNIRTDPSTPSTAAELHFVEVDPGTTTETFRHVYYKQPAPILSDTIQHEMPGATDMDYLIPATMMLIDSINDHEKLVNAREYIRTVLSRQFWKEQNTGEQGVSSYSVKRPY